MTPTPAPPALAPPADDPVRAALADPALLEELTRQALVILSKRLADKPAAFRRQVAGEVAAQALETAWASRHRFDPAVGVMAGWVHGILVNVIYSSARAARRQPAQPPADAGGWDGLAAKLDPGPDAADARHDAAAHLARLNPADRELLTLRFIDGLDPDQIAARLGIKPGAARVRLCRALTAAKAAAAEDRP